MDFDLLYPGRFLKSAQFSGRDVTLTIKAVRTEELEGDKGKQVKPIVSFVERPLELVLNRTNGLSIRAMFGRETNDWIGKRVTLYPEKYHDNTTGEDTTCIRVRGSPDLKAAVTFELKLPRKKGVTKTLKRTGAKANGAAPTPAPTPEPPPMSQEEIEAIEAAERGGAA